jgi:hypothetical protein
MGALTRAAGLTALALGVLAAPAAADEKKAEPAAAPSLEEALASAARDVLKEARARKIKNVGTLKFVVTLGDVVERPNLGSLNYSLPDRLEVALILAQDPDTPPAQQIGVIKRCNATVAKTGAAGLGNLNHRNKAGRAKFFELRKAGFQRGWGRDDQLDVPVNADLMFITGEAALSKDLRTLKITVQGFHNRPEKALEKEKLELITLATVTAAVEPRLLSEVGVSYDGSRSPLRGKREEEVKKEREEPVVKAEKFVPREKDTTQQADDKVQDGLKLLKTSPVKLEILLDGKAVEPIRNPLKPPADHVLLAVPPIKEGQRLTFRLTNTDSSTLGVLLRVNGENTIFPDEDRDTEGYRCFKWVLSPKGQKGDMIEVKGFQTKDDSRNKFEVVSDEEAIKGGMRYTDATGTFQFEVYRSRQGDGDALAMKDEDKRSGALTMIGRGGQALSRETRAVNLKALQEMLRKDANAVTDCRDGRSVVIKGAGEKNEVERIGFNAFPDPYVSVTIRYFTPKK